MNFRIARFTLIALLCLFFVKPSFAQIIKKQGFTIQLGVFRFPDKSRFVSLSDLGEVYTEELPNQLTRIRLGRYETRKQADSILKIVHQREYTRSIVVPTEFVVPVQQVPPVNVKTNPIPNDPNKPQKGGRLDRPPMARPAAYSIQIGANDKKIGLIDISTLDQIGRVYEVEQDSMKKVLVGMFNDKDSAEAQLKMVRSMGYKDAFLVETDVQDVLITLPSSPLNKDLTQTYRPIRNFETASFYKRMEGTLNNIFPVIVHAYFSSASITGFYDDPKSKMRKKFVYYGYRAGTNSLPETQFSSENGLVVKASASPKSESIKLSFTVKDIETNETLNFSLREIYPTGSVQFDIISIYKKKSQQGTNGELGADLYLEYPTIIGVGSKIVESKINTVASQLSNEVEGETMMSKVDVQLKDGIEKVLSYYPQYRWLSQTYETKV
ncbi:MAG: hypothetical protein MUE81_21765, partial [Thermoflexibacter sp.]|nr:hypothetical protein [Thermoflexibacter sp.]